jgi:hypothetical protein
MVSQNRIHHDESYSYSEETCFLILKGDTDWKMSWKDTFENFKARVPYMQEDTLIRNRNQNTTGHFSFVLEMEPDANIPAEVQDAMTTIGSLFNCRPGKTHCGQLFIDYLKMHGPHKLLDYLKREMQDNDEKATADCFAVEMDRYLRQGMLMYEWNSTLDKIWPNFKIKSSCQHMWELTAGMT